MFKKYLSKILLFLSQFCYEEMMDDEKISQQPKDQEHIEGDLEFLKEIDPVVYTICGIDDSGNQFVNMTWKDDHPDVVKYIVACIVSLGTGNTASLVLNSLTQNKSNKDKSQKIIDEVLLFIESAMKDNSFDMNDNPIMKDSPIMSPLDVFKNIGNQ